MKEVFFLSGYHATRFDSVDEVIRSRSVFVNPTPRRETNDGGEDIADLMKYCMDELSK